MASEPVIHVGTSGFSYDDWRPGFYPEDLNKADLLSCCAERLQACELSNTFYRMPSDKTVRAWNEQGPDGFPFAIKASRRISWNQKLVDCGELCAYLFGQLEPLGTSLAACSSTCRSTCAATSTCCVVSSRSSPRA